MPRLLYDATTPSKERDSMDYLDAWNQGYEKGRAMELELINKFCETEFETMTDVIAYINDAKFFMSLEGQDV